MKMNVDSLQELMMLMNFLNQSYRIIKYMHQFIKYYNQKVLQKGLIQKKQRIVDILL